MPAAFGDYNSDKLTDIFVVHEDTLEVLVSDEHAPLLRPAGLKCQFPNVTVRSVVPGDFDGDSVMDVMFTTVNPEGKGLIQVYVIWGSLSGLNCKLEDAVHIQMYGQPLMLDYNYDMISDLFGNATDGLRTVWVFSDNRTTGEVKIMGQEQTKLRVPHSHAFVDVTGDNAADLVVTTDEGIEVWNGGMPSQFLELGQKYQYPNGVNVATSGVHIGQSIFADFDLKKSISHILPMCFDIKCTNSSLFMYTGQKWVNLNVNFVDPKNTRWGFVPSLGKLYTDTVTLRSGDFNLDGYPDLLATLADTSASTKPKAFLLENVGCSDCESKRTFAVKWDLHLWNSSVMAAFYDIYEDGILDILVVHEPTPNKFEVAAFKNNLETDSYFVKVLVLTGRCGDECNVGKFRVPYGTNLPGPTITYKTTKQDGAQQTSRAAQLSQSAHFALQLPYTVFGLGRTQNFVENLGVGIGWPEENNRYREWTQIIPNSQQVVIPHPLGQPNKWHAKLFVTPSKLVLQTAFALLGTCIFIMFIIFFLHWRERREDKKEKLQQAHRFHFDAM